MQTKATHCASQCSIVAIAHPFQPWRRCRIQVVRHDQIGHAAEKFLNIRFLLFCIDCRVWTLVVTHQTPMRSIHGCIVARWIASNIAFSGWFVTNRNLQLGCLASQIGYVGTVPLEVGVLTSITQIRILSCSSVNSVDVNRFLSSCEFVGGNPVIGGIGRQSFASPNQKTK